ncbi:aldehyde dehydrogenase family protein [Trinickia violacea]|uniref:Aldehyde dehydrogenase family protein n=1 Tax=Trinickia violacea TaxID=2571746 RepID=A0A4P8IYB3_9BURK|nr:aldehyde dehydrogenase family protein [Trinickia violacea]QCP54322.1 aldehyde dehydrogenase family protein [Trinickia violacea]
MSATIDVHSPFDGTHVGQVEAATAEDVERAMATAYALFRDRRQWLSKQQRLSILKRAAEIISARREEIARQAASEGGKPLKDSLIEVDRGIDGIHTCIEALRTNAGQVVPMDLNATSAGRVAFTQYEPAGVVLGVSAFNHPFNLVIHQVAPAVAVGAPVIVKPAPATPLSCRTVIDIFHEAGLPPGWAQMVLPQDLELATRMVTDPRVGFFTFIGSAPVGWMLRSKLAPGTRCALEHGGVAPVIVSHDADLDMALPRIARGAFWHAGQACVSVQRVFCHRSIAGDVAHGLAELGNKMVIGDPLLTTTDVGPLISHKEVDRVGRWIDDAVSAGGTLVSGGKRISASCYANTVLLDPPGDADVTRKEVFGPVVCVYAYDNVDAAIATSNDLPYSFQAAVFTRNIDTAMHCYRHLDGTAIMVNENTLFRVDWMPFAGARVSGHGVGGMPHTMREMQTEKMMVWRSDALN